MTVIVTDSTADLPAVLVKSLDVTVVPLTVNFGSESFADGVEITNDQFYKRLTEADQLPSTSQPSVGMFKEAYERIAKPGETIISIHIAGELSGTIRSAQQAAELLPDYDIRIIDSRSTTMSLGWAVMAAARAVKNGKSADEAEALARSYIERTRLLACLDTLRYLEKGGRIGRTRALLGTLLSVKPIIDVRNGEIAPFEQVRTKKKAVARLKAVAESLGPFDEFCVLHSRSEDEARAFAQELNHIHPTAQIVIAEIGAVVGTHIGPGAIGFTGVQKQR